MKRSTALLFTLVVFLLLAANSTDFFFRTPYYETWDSAANAFSVDRAKHFAQLYGPYSRWGFNHPGPALFYLQALGEWVFYDLLHLTPAPFNAQTLLYLFASTGFFVATLQVFSSWLPTARSRWWFLCAAIAFAIVHFTSTNALPSYDALTAPSAFLSLWSAHVLLLPFLCLLTAGASVAAGRGTDLPLVTLAGGFLLHTHVAQPLFVVPLSLLAYGGLLWQSARRQTSREAPPTSVDRLLAAWRAWPRAHLAAAAILGVFLLPIALDLTRGSQSNFAAILHHVHTHRGEHKPLSLSWFYFLQFGAYAPYRPHQLELLHPDAAGVRAYLRGHAVFYVGWSAVAALVLWAGTRAAWPRPHRPANHPPATNDWREARRFLTWATAFFVACLVLTLYWGTIQDGQLFYYNAWFNFGLYYFGLLIALAVVCEWLLGITRDANAPTPARLERIASVAAVLVLAGFFSGKLRIRDPDPASTLAMHDSVARALAATAPADGRPVIQSLRFTDDLWIIMAGVGIQIERAGQPFCVPDGWALFFGLDHGWTAQSADLLHAGRVQVWRFGHKEGFEAAGVPSTRLETTSVDRRNAFLPDDIAVNFTLDTIDPSRDDQASIRLVTGGNVPPFIQGGWSFQEGWGTWSESPHAVLGFHADPVDAASAGVEITLLGLHPFLNPAHRLNSQRLRVLFNGEPIGGEHRLEADVDSFTYQVPADLWNRAASGFKAGQALLELDFPDAASPASFDPGLANPDMRKLGVGLREVRFDLATPPGADSSPATPD